MSQNLLDKLQLQEEKNVLIQGLPSSIEKQFVKLAFANKSADKQEKIILMLCSLKGYKGVDQFLKLAQTNPKYLFKLVVNASVLEIQQYCMIEQNFIVLFESSNYYSLKCVK